MSSHDLRTNPLRVLTLTVERAGFCLQLQFLSALHSEAMLNISIEWFWLNCTSVYEIK